MENEAKETNEAMLSAPELHKLLARERERAEYAWQNTRTIEKARQAEMEKRDALQSALEEAHRQHQELVVAHGRQVDTIAALAAAIHYPDCWDTAAYPTLASALTEVHGTFRCTAEGACAVSAGAMERIEQWAQAYPEDVFPEPDWEEVKAKLGSTLLSRVSAANMRHVITKVRELLAPNGEE